MMTAVILMTNCTRSVQSTAHMPAATEYIIVTKKQMPTAITSPETVMPAICTSRSPSEIVRILIIARVTQPRMIRLIGIARYSARNARSAAARVPLYRTSANSTSVITLARRHSRAKKNTVSMPLISIFHHSQFPATPCDETSPVTTSGVSAANVVATIDAPASHHGTARPEMKYSLRLSPPFFVNAKPMPADSAKYAKTMAQSTSVMCMSVYRFRWSSAMTASANATRTRPILLLLREGFTRLLSRMMKTSLSGSIQMDVPVNPVWPKAFAESR